MYINTAKPTKAERSRNMRYKKPALASMGYDAITAELDEINEVCSDIRWYMDDKDTLLMALDGDEEAEYEFRMAFSDLGVKAEQLSDTLYDGDVRDYFDDCTVALIGNRYKAVGFDSQKEDYFALTSYEKELAYTESGKKLMRRTKQDMLSIIGQCVGVTLAFFDLRQSYDYLKATMDILRDKNTSLLDIIRDIDKAYEDADAVGFKFDWSPEVKQYETLISQLPDRMWLE